MEVSQSFIANVAILNKLLAKETWYNTFFSRFSGPVGKITDDNGNVKYEPSGKPIEVLNDFISEGRDNMLIPFLKDLTGAPVFGDTVLKGTGEELVMNWMRAYVNQYRKAVMKRSGQMSEQRAKIYKLFEAAKPQLARWFAKYENQSIFRAFYEGVSPNLSAGTDDDGLGLVVRYHPNWYINDDSALTTIGAEETTKTAAGITTSTSACNVGMTADILMELRLKCMELRIPQIVSKSGQPYWAMLVHPSQMNDLRAETEFKNAQREAFSGRALDSSELSGAQGFYAGFALFEDIVGVRAWDGSTLFGATTATMLAPTATTTNYNAIVFGNSAMGRAVARDAHFTSEIDDHENTHEIGGAIINGYGRNDYFTEATADETSGEAFYKGNTSTAVSAAISATNQSSLILMTT